MSIEDAPHFVLQAKELAAWIEKQGTDRWWNVDGDPLLTGRLDFPCPGDELAAELRKIDRLLLVQDKQKRSNATGQEIHGDEIDTVVDRLENNVQITGNRKPHWLKDRLLYLCWKGSRNEWLLVEDEETTERTQDDLAHASKKG